MKQMLLYILLSGTCGVRAQLQYVTEKNIRYYPDSINKKDDYTASQCTLDFYYPKDAKNYATIIWFHGGGLTGGTKEIPAALMNKGYAIAGIEYRLSPR